MMTNTQITITQPDDWHLHLRDGEALNSVAPFTASQFARAIIMPNLKPPVTTVAQAVEYLDRILAAADGSDFEPLMTLYLTDNTSPAEIIAARKSCFIKGLKLYPAGATTNSDAGVTDIRLCDAALEAMQTAGTELGLPAETARLLTLQTALGAAKMALERSESVTTLRERVTSPGGTTEQGLRVLADNNIDELMAKVLKAAADRSRELASELGNNLK